MAAEAARAVGTWVFKDDRGTGFIAKAVLAYTAKVIIPIHRYKNRCGS